ncbi:MAG TPA: tripartite tricarboxylate transporter substrate binding protein [Burkholderiales bacterium]|nr:tripartite tricarboxylate transporter substrate binding protein [Burkholderiales bacterium]
MKTIIRILAAIAAAGAAQAFAQGYPNKPVHAIISFTAGSSTDIVGRIVLQKLSEMWGQPVVPENRAGAGGSIGTAVVAKAAPDGYTLLVDSNAHTVTPSIYAKLPYDAINDFVDISPLALQPNVLIVNASSQYKTLMDVVNAAKAKPGAINWGHAGVGSGTHLNTEKFVAAAKINVTQIPFKGTPEVIQAMLSNSVDCYWAPISAAIPHIKGGRVRPLAVSTPKRNSQLPNVPTTGEAGIQGADAPLWFGLWAPAGTPKDIVAKISADTRKALADPAVRDRLQNLGNDTMDMSPEEFARFVRSEHDEYARVIKAAGIKPQ